VFAVVAFAVFPHLLCNHSNNTEIRSSPLAALGEYDQPHMPTESSSKTGAVVGILATGAVAGGLLFWWWNSRQHSSHDDDFAHDIRPAGAAAAGNIPPAVRAKHGGTAPTADPETEILGEEDGDDEDWETEYSTDEELEEKLRMATMSYLQEELHRLTQKKQTKPGAFTAEDEESLRRIIEDMREVMMMGAPGGDWGAGGGDDDDEDGWGFDEEGEEDDEDWDAPVGDFDMRRREVLASHVEEVDDEDDEGADEAETVPKRRKLAAKKGAARKGAVPRAVPKPAAK
jgi:hypothetical protein